MKVLIVGEYGKDIKSNVFQLIRDGDELMIDSCGGTLKDGKASFDSLVGSDISGTVYGACYSSATLSLMACRKRFGTPNSSYLIHFPVGRFEGDAEAMKAYAQELEAIQSSVVDIYEKNLLIPREEIMALMSENKRIDAVEAKRIGLIQEIINLNDIKMSFKGEFGKLLNDVKMIFSDVTAPEEKMSITLQTTCSQELTFDVDTQPEIIVGTGVTLAGKAFDGVFVCCDQKYTVVAGKVSMIEPTEEIDQAAMDSMQMELKGVIETMTTFKTKEQELMQSVQSKDQEIAALTAKVTELEKMNFTEKKPEDVPANEDSKQVMWKYKNKNK